MEKKGHDFGKSCFFLSIEVVGKKMEKKKFFSEDFFLNFYRFIYLSYFLYGEKMDIIKEERKGKSFTYHPLGDFSPMAPILPLDVWKKRKSF